MPAFLIIKTLSGPGVSQFDPFAHFLKLFSFLLLIHVSSLSSWLFDLSEAKIININRLRDDISFATEIKRDNPGLHLVAKVN